jgi:hypothetical protein
MEQWITRLLLGCGGMAGLMLGTGQTVEAATLACATIFTVWLLRTHADPSSR